ncbi:periostin [Anabrus simplex]|uniref:periostin n=1 Tax=Anabrus simplex TaxID=316456 RepID=UPI0035A2C115
MVNNAFLSHVIVNGIHCSVMLNNATLRTSGGSMLRSRCTSRGTRVAAANITKADIMASNGVLHFIDKVVMPRRGRSLAELLTELGLTTLLSLLPDTGLLSAYHGRNTFTIFAPTNQAFQALGNATLKLLSQDREEARNLLLGHMTSGRQLMQNLLDRQVLEAKRPSHSLRIKITRGKRMVNDAVIHRTDIEGSNGVIHIIDKVLIPAEHTIVKYLESRGIFNRFLAALNMTSPSLMDVLESDKAPFTVFAVSDLAINHWSTDLFTYERMMSDTHVVNTIMRTHVVPDTIFTTGLTPGSYYQVDTLNTEPLLIRRLYGSNAPAYAGIALIQRANVLCTNGVIHVVNRLIQVANPSYS